MGIMSNSMFPQMDSLHLDVLKEISSIGTGNAISSLSKITNKRINMELPKVMFLEFKDVHKSIGNPEDMVAGILVTLSGDINGMVMFILNIRTARSLINYFYEKPTATHEFDELDRSALEEMGNILISSYISALGTLINKRIIPSVPTVALDMAAAILSVPAIEFSKVADGVMHIETVFSAGTDQMSGYFLLVPELDSFNVIMKALGAY
jgi:chemotaxis protein CheC